MTAKYFKCYTYVTKNDRSITTWLKIRQLKYKLKLPIKSSSSWNLNDQINRTGAANRNHQGEVAWDKDDKEGRGKERKKSNCGNTDNSHVILMSGSVLPFWTNFISYSFTDENNQRDTDMMIFLLMILFSIHYSEF